MKKETWVRLRRLKSQFGHSVRKVFIEQFRRVYLALNALAHSQDNILSFMFSRPVAVRQLRVKRVVCRLRALAKC